MKRHEIEKYLEIQGYNMLLIKKLDDKEIRRIYILELLFNSQIVL